MRKNAWRSVALPRCAMRFSDNMPTALDPLLILDTGEIALEGEFLWGSNYTLLVTVDCGDEQVKAVYKPTRGVRPLWDFDAPTLARREVLAYIVSEALGWELVPPTVFRMTGPLGPGSLQLYVDHDPEYHYFNFSREDRERLRPAAVFDVLINNADRKGGHFILDADRHIWLIDHGICFHEEPKLRTVLWDFAGEPIPEDLAAGVAAFEGSLTADTSTSRAIRTQLSGREYDALGRRASRLLTGKVFPLPPRDARPYPWPLV
jgi:uncharacterized repeat protein (TIGR03843 family)